MNFLTKITHMSSEISDGLKKQIKGAIQAGIHSKYQSLPAIPIADIDGMRETLKRMSEREAEAKQVKLSLDRSYTINGHTAKGYEFLYGYDLDKKNPISEAAKALQGSLKGDKDLVKQIRELMEEDVLPRFKGTQQDPTKLSLDDPTQWSMTWSPMRNIYDTGMTNLDRWVSSLTDYQAATEQFWETISTYSLPFNLLILQKVRDSHLTELKPKFEAAWTAEMDILTEKGLLYMIDMSIFTTVKPQTVDGLTRFTPATITLLQQNPDTKALTPIAVRVSGHEDANLQVYTHPSSGLTSPSAWLYALQAAKVSLTVYGIWLGHVYHYHLISAAMLMTLQETVSDDHPLRKLIDPQSKYLIEFDTVLLLIWKQIAPPASIASTPQFLELCNTFAAKHQFLQDDPLAVLERNQIREADFTEKEPWDRYPVMKDYLEVWHACATYTNAFVDDTYADDAAIVGDQTLQDWITNSADPSGGNIKGLPEMKGKQALKQVLSSLIYRLTVHGVARLNKTSQPAVAFISNFPPCLHRDDIPNPTTDFDTKALLQYLPVTGTAGRMLEFFLMFAFSSPNEPLIPHEGVESNLFFEEGSGSNEALIQFRKDMTQFILRFEGKTHYEGGEAVIERWPMCIEL